MQVQKTKRTYESVTAFQRALVLIVSLKQLFSSHSVPTSHTQLPAACTHMYIHPHSHFIYGGNRHSFCVSLSPVNVSFYSHWQALSTSVMCFRWMRVLNRLTLILFEVLDVFFPSFIKPPQVFVHNNALCVMIILETGIWSLQRLSQELGQNFTYVSLVHLVNKDTWIDFQMCYK